MVGSILQRIYERSRLATVVGLWSFLAPLSPSVRNLAGATLIDDLRNEYTPAQLEAARVLIRRGDSRVELNPVLEGESTRGLFLRSAKGEPPFDIVNQNGSLTTDDPPAFGHRRDHFKSVCRGGTNLVLVAFSDDDLLILRSLGLTCIPAAGLAAMDGKQVGHLFDGVPRSSVSAANQLQAVPVGSNSYQLILVGWNVSDLSSGLPGGMVSVIERVLKVEDLYGFDTSQRVVMWRPTEREISHIRSAAEFQDRVLIKKLIFPSLDCSTCSAKKFDKETASRKKTDYVAARQLLLDTIARHGKAGLRSQAVIKELEEFNRSFEQNVVDAIIRDAIATTNSFDRGLLLMASELMGHWHTNSTLVRSTHDGINGRYHSQEEPLNQEEVNERLRVVDGLVKIHRELTRNK